MIIVRVLAWIFALGAIVWAAGALWYDFPVAELRVPLVVIFLGLAAVAAWRARSHGRKIAALLAMFALVATLWFTLQPRQDRIWQADVDRTAWAEIDGDSVTLHNVRKFEYRTEQDYTPHWETRVVRLSQLTGVDLAICRWGSPHMAHPITSFQFVDAPPVCFSIETRKEKDEKYSAVGGLFRRYELIYIVADERDVLRLRSNYRQGEEVYLYRTTIAPEGARERFVEYLKAVNALHEKARWYNAATTNCTTSIRTQRSAADRQAWDWRILFNGRIDELLYERGALNSAGLPFELLQKNALINSAAQAANDAPDFSRRVRENRAGF